MIKPTKWGRLKDLSFISKSSKSWYKQLNILIVSVLLPHDMLIPQNVGLHSMKNRQSGEFCLISFNLRNALVSTMIKLRFLRLLDLLVIKYLQCEEFYLKTFNLRKFYLSFNFQIPHIAGFRYTKNLQSGKFSHISYNLRKSWYSIQF